MALGAPAAENVPSAAKMAGLAFGGFPGFMIIQAPTMEWRARALGVAS